MYKRILVTTDGSETAGNASQHAAALAKLTGATDVLVLHVCTGCTADLDPDEKNRELAERIVSEAGELFTRAGVPVRTMVENEYPPESIGKAIIDTAESEDIELIVMGSRGLTEFKGMMLGSVSNKVVHGAACPVLIVKADE